MSAAAICVAAGLALLPIVLTIAGFTGWTMRLTALPVICPLIVLAVARAMRTAEQGHVGRAR